MREKTSPQQMRWNEERERGFVTANDTAPDAFVSWWTGHDHCSQRMRSKDGVMGYSSGITAHKAWQLECYRLEFRERRQEHASGTGINYAYYGSHQPTSQSMPELIKHASTFGDIKEVITGLSEQMSMNKAIEWTQADSDAINDPT